MFFFLQEGINSAKPYTVSGGDVATRLQLGFLFCFVFSP